MTKTNDDLPTWKLIPGTGGKYLATIEGEVYKVTVRDGALTFWELAQRWDSFGYPHVVIDGRDTPKARAVAAAWGIIPSLRRGDDPASKAFVTYKDGNRTNTRPDNLRAETDNWTLARKARLEKKKDIKE